MTAAPRRGGGRVHPALGIALLTLGAALTYPALTIESCTQGGADSLRFGVVTLILYAAGGAMLAAQPPRPAHVAALLPAAALAAWHSLFALRFAWHYWRSGVSACDALAGRFAPAEGDFPPDGGEPWLTCLWLLLSLLFWLSAAAGLARGRAAARAKPDSIGA
ncbi:MAG TPA: hypothetical protein VGB79_05720 [Allosphingosinicella sp.]